VVLAEIGGDAYNVVLVLHILAVVGGIGAMMLNGVYGAQAKARKGPEGLAIAEANLKVASIAEWIIYTIPVFGIALVFMSESGGERVYDFDQTWIWLTIVLFVVAIGLAHGVMFPTAKKMQGLMRELAAMRPPPAGGPPPGGPPAQAVELAALGKRIAAGGATLNLLTIAMIGLMVWKPGF
jgi:hypothetical protein